MRLAMLQTAGDRHGNPAANLDRLGAAAAQAAASGADLLLAPEMFLSGYNIGRAALQARAEAPDGPAARHAAILARRHGIALCYGYPERGPDGAIYNAARLVDRTGAVRLTYRKTHLYGSLDRDLFAPGDGIGEVVEIAGLKMGLLICYDIEFPEAARALALNGADLILVPTANMKPFVGVSNVVVPARAFENLLFVAYANRVGQEGELTYLGMSCVGEPSGGHLVLAGEEDGIIYADLDPAALKAARASNGHLADRRPELYGRLSPG
ncbi:carbon-nitrogen hydrolase family protein [Ancylobacter sonchi]|uniref:carbon-nitrogen hydrolase family protein n=1 Tax=Ancylobacter sonchi TaxID=1937790 RepID=UPI001BD315E1|nr:carbon-nitrogen hydrolase family protein [Ancylobacter sonchi]MBS7535541.1 carbon-nitrogen hydrolase family protein [Ancylobacter sonchi]